MFISYGANSTSKAPRPTYSSSGKSSTVSQKRPQTEQLLRTTSGNLFQARGAAAAKERSPKDVFILTTSSI